MMTQNDNLHSDDNKIPTFTPEQIKNLVDLAKFQLGEKISRLTSELNINMHHLVSIYASGKILSEKKRIFEPVFARYNPPFQIWFLRRNEVLIPVE